MQNFVLLKGGDLRITVPSKKEDMTVFNVVLCVSRNYRQGGGGVEGGPCRPDRKKSPLSEKSSDKGFFVVVFQSLSSTF